MTDVLQSIINADRTWASRHRRPPAPPEYLVHLAAAVELDSVTEVEQMELQLAELRRLVKDLVVAVTGRWSRYRNLGRQVAVALAEIAKVEAYLLSLQPEPQARAG